MTQISLKINRKINKEEFLKIMKDWYEKVPVKVKEKKIKKEYLPIPDVSPEEIIEIKKQRRKEYYEKNKEEIKRKEREKYKEKNITTYKKQTTITDDERKEKIKKYQEEYRRNKGIKPRIKMTKEEQKQRRKEYYEKNKNRKK